MPPDLIGVVGKDPVLQNITAYTFPSSKTVNKAILEGEPMAVLLTDTLSL